MVESRVKIEKRGIGFGRRGSELPLIMAVGGDQIQLRINTGFEMIVDI